MQTVRPKSSGHLAQGANPPQVLVMAAVGEVEAGNIHPEQQELTNPLLGAGGRAEGADNFGAPPRRRLQLTLFGEQGLQG